MQRKTTGAMTAFAITSILSVQVFADATPEDAAEYRASVMTAMGGHMGAASKIVRGLIADDGHLAAHARGLALVAAELERVFPQGSNVGDSEALPLIWEEPEAFAKAISRVQKATVDFVTVADSGDKEAIGPAFRRVGKACGGCHDKFRVDDD